MMRQSSVHETGRNLEDEQLLDVRMADLPLRIEGTLAERIAQLRDELDARGLALPAALLSVRRVVHARRRHRDRHPVLPGASAAREARGSADARSRRRRARVVHAHPPPRGRARHRQRVPAAAAAASAARSSAHPSTPYPEFYTPKPYSKSFVLHLDSWYAQSHPDEDFAETFAVWLTPNSEWRQRYAGWPALKKLEYMDALMRSLRERDAAASTTRRKSTRCRRLRKTLRQHYRNKRRHYGVDYPNFYDRDLRRLFSDAPEFADNITAAQFIARIRRPVRRVVAGWTGIYQYTIDQVLEDMIARCRELKLRLAVPEEQARQEFTVLLTVQAMNYLHSGGHRAFL